MKPRVEIYRLKWYDLNGLRKLMDRIFFSRSGLFSRGDRVLVKPNLLAPTKTERAVVTHPVFLRAVVEKLLELGTKPYIGDSPALSSADKVARVSGIKRVAQELGVALIELDSPVEVKSEGFFKRLEISKRLLEFDKIVNLPKFKTHTQMVLTLAVKNMFGTIPGRLKAEWHVRASEPLNFARMLISVYETSRPVLNIMDGIVAMEGEGPQNGRPYPMGLVLVSEDGLALDLAASKMVGAEKVFYLGEVTRREGLWREAEVSGDFAELPRFSDFTLPSTTPLSPSLARRFLRRSLPKPKILPEKCTACGFCKEACPTGSILEVGKSPRFNYSTCISCFVCQEVCPFDAIELSRGLLHRLFRF